jgi:glutamate-ammonia-ligase adenylyltransferase
MRQRMRQELDRSTAETVDLKQCRGGIVDIEFMVQWCVLLHSSEHAALLRYTDNLRLLDELSRAALLGGDEVAALKTAYFELRQRINQLALQEKPSLVPADELAGQRETVARIWDRYLEPDRN